MDLTVIQPACFGERLTNEEFLAAVRAAPLGELLAGEHGEQIVLPRDLDPTYRSHTDGEQSLGKSKWLVTGRLLSGWEGNVPHSSTGSAIAFVDCSQRCQQVLVSAEPTYSGLGALRRAGLIGQVAHTHSLTHTHFPRNTNKCSHISDKPAACVSRTSQPPRSLQTPFRVWTLPLLAATARCHRRTVQLAHVLPAELRP